MRALASTFRSGEASLPDLPPFESADPGAGGGSKSNPPFKTLGLVAENVRCFWLFGDGCIRAPGAELAQFPSRSRSDGIGSAVA